MTSIQFESEGARLVGFSMEGHSGYAAAGTDIVCAAISSAVRLVECALNDVAGLGAAVKLREEDAYLAIKLPAKLEEEAEALAQTLLASLMLHLVSLAEEYPQNIIVMEV